ncbi:hypothetical protein [Isoptericola croceus]|uniref:hypothetical protein n=1 Tax=Isoptericola croceus TaxID=3031406 RepID=UPI0023F8D41D|nr:hypothetical protein [Isoptericola croceus]
MGLRTDGASHGFFASIPSSTAAVKTVATFANTTLRFKHGPRGGNLKFCSVNEATSQS